MSKPVLYNEIAANPSEGMEISTRVLSPVLIISLEDGTFHARLGTRRSLRGKERLVMAQNIYADWVNDDGLIFPLPHDAPEIAATMLAGMDPSDLSLSEILLIENRAGENLPVYRDLESFSSANHEAERGDVVAEIPGLNATLYDYQSRGVSWMSRTLRHTGGVILADEMGLGKTIQIIALFLLNPPVNHSPALIICPTTLTENWVRELRNFAPCLSANVHRGPDRAGLHKDLLKANVIITTYDTLVNDSVIFSAIEWAYIVFDEAQALKNPSSKRRKAASALNSKITIPVTGTPVENGLLDLWSLIDIAIPGLLGTQNEFELNFADDIDSARMLARLTDPFILKRQVADVAQDLPERINIDVPLELGDRLSKQYEDVRTEILSKYGRAGALVATGQLQLLCAHPRLRSNNIGVPDWEDEVDIVESVEEPLFTPKIERTVDLLKEAFLRRKKVLIFSNFNRCEQLIREAAAGLPEAYWNSINGSTPQERRQAIVDEFSEYDGPAILILNPRAAGAGLNITAATIVIHFTQVWNPALEKQASARAYRRGQREPVTIYRIFYVNTVEEVMLDRTLWKSELGNEAVPISVRDAADLSRALSISPVSKQ